MWHTCIAAICTRIVAIYEAEKTCRMCRAKVGDSSVTWEEKSAEKAIKPETKLTALKSKLKLPYYSARMLGNYVEFPTFLENGSRGVAVVVAWFQLTLVTP